MISQIQSNQFVSYAIFVKKGEKPKSATAKKGVHSLKTQTKVAAKATLTSLRFKINEPAFKYKRACI